MASPKSEEQKIQEQQEREEKAVSCIVKFRPCKDWRGEYGFDWVREGKDDYEERIDLGNDVKEYKELLPPETIKTIKDEAKIKLDSVEGMSEDFEYYDMLLAFYESHFIQEYIKNHPQEVIKPSLVQAQNAWKNSNRGFFEQSIYNLEVDEGEKPIEYCYPAKFVTFVSYRSETIIKQDNGIETNLGNIFYRDAYTYKDMANGNKEIEDSEKPLLMDSFVEIPGHRFSLCEGKEAPYYTDYGPHDASRFCSFSHKLELYNERNGSFREVNVKADATQLVIDFLKGKYNERYYLFCKGLDPYLRTFDEVPFLSHKKIGFTNVEKHIFYSLHYVIFADGYLLYAVAKDLDKNESCSCIYKNGKLAAYLPMDGNMGRNDRNVGWKTVKRTKGELSDVDKTADNFANEYFTNQMKDNDSIDLKWLLDQKEYRDISFSISNPTKLEKCHLEEPLFKTEDNGVSYWGCYPIKKWEDWYKESSFHQREFYLKKDKEIEDRNYIIPILSVLPEDKAIRTRFEFRSPKDAPRTSKEPANEYKIQLRIEGDCPKLRFKTNNPNVAVDPEEMPSPNDGDSITVKIASDSVPCMPSVFAYCVDKKDKEKEVGQLLLNINIKRKINLVFIRVSIGGKKLSESYEDCLNDQKKALTNALLPAGIVPRFFNYEIDISNRTIKKYKVSKESINPDPSGIKRIVEVIIDKFLEKYKEFYIIPLEYLFIFLDKKWAADASAYSCTYEKKNIKYNYTFYSNDIAMNRCVSYTIAHELYHSLGLAHHFQLVSLHNNYFCFPIATTSNIMDYYTLGYSSHQGQWWVMRYTLDKHNQWVEENWKSYAERKQKKKDGKIEATTANEAIIHDVKKYRKII